MKLHKKIIVSALVAGSLTAIALKPIHIGPPEAYPNPQLTPGLVATTDINELTSVSSCGTYSKCHRKTTNVMKETVCREYHDNCNGTQEIDHFCPLAIGCADDVKNLWAEPEHIMWHGMDVGYHTKDVIEARLAILVKAELISPKDAQHCILSDWIACYQKYVKPTFGAMTPLPIIDPDDETD